MITPQIQHSTHSSSTQPAVGVLLVHGLNANTGDMAELEDIKICCPLVGKSGHKRYIMN